MYFHFLLQFSMAHSTHNFCVQNDIHRSPFISRNIPTPECQAGKRETKILTKQGLLGN